MLAGIPIGLTLAAKHPGRRTCDRRFIDNPARTLGPALVAGETAYLIPYFAGMFGGGIIGGLVHGYVLRPEV